MRPGPLPLLALAMVGAAAPSLFGEERAPEEIVAEFDGVRYPGFGSNLSMEEFGKRVEAASSRQCALAKELLDGHPDHPDVPRLMQTRWTLQINVDHDAPRVLSETDPFTKRPDTDALAKAAHLVRGMAGVRAPGLAPKTRFALVKEAMRTNPDKPQWCATFLTSLAREHIANPKKQRALCELARKRYPKADESIHAGSFLALLDRVGSPLELRFDDPVTNQPQGTHLHRGHRVLLHVWMATPHEPPPGIETLRSLANAGLAIIGVHQGDLPDEQLLEFTRQHQMTWPQFVDREQLQGWAWKLGARGPTFLLLDEQGRLAGVTSSIEPLRRALAEQSAR